MRTRNSSYVFDETLGARLARLRELLVTGEQLAEASDYFHEALVPDEGFLKSGADAEDPRLLGILGGVLETVAPGGQLAFPMTLRLEKHAMCHGCAFWRNGIVLFLFRGSRPRAVLVPAQPDGLQRAFRALLGDSRSSWLVRAARARLRVSLAQPRVMKLQRPAMGAKKESPCA
jgi:hypothetical protein